MFSLFFQSMTIRSEWLSLEEFTACYGRCQNQATWWLAKQGSLVQIGLLDMFCWSTPFENSHKLFHIKELTFQFLLNNASILNFYLIQRQPPGAELQVPPTSYMSAYTRQALLYSLLPLHILWCWLLPVHRPLNVWCVLGLGGYPKSIIWSSSFLTNFPLRVLTCHQTLIKATFVHQRGLWGLSSQKTHWPPAIH